jgi:hypothetical protein
MLVLRLFAMDLAMISEVPPVANGTTKRMVFSGYSADATPDEINITKARNQFFTEILLVV